MGSGKSKGRTGDGKVVESHPLYEEIYDLACNRYSSESIVRMLQYQHAAEFESGEIPPLPNVRTIHRWRRHRTPEKDVLPLRVLQQKLDSLDQKIDLMQATQQLYAVAEDRVARLTSVEENLDLPLPGVDQAIQTLLKIGEQLWRLGQDVGLYPRQPGAWLTMGLKEGGAGGGMVLLQLGDGPPRQIDLRSPDLSQLQQEELDALRAMPIEGEAVVLPEGKNSDA